MIPYVPSLEERMEDIRFVLDAAGSERAIVMGFSEGGPASALLAASAPERVASLILYGSFARGPLSADPELQECWYAGKDHLDEMVAVPFTLRNLKEDLEDIGSRFDDAPDLEFRMATGALELEKSGLSYQRVPPGYRFPYGHTHKKQEEVYVVLRGSGRMKLDDEIVELEEWDAVRVPPGNSAEGSAFLLPPAQAISATTPRATSSTPATIAIRIAIRRPSRRNQALKRSTRPGVASGCSR